MIVAHVIDSVNLCSVVFQILESFGACLRKFSRDPSLPNPDSFIRADWNSDPYCLGAWSHPGMLMEEHELEVLSEPLENEDHKPKVFFAGEATDSKNWSFINGARLSGLREGQRILDIVSGNRDVA